MAEAEGARLLRPRLAAAEGGSTALFRAAARASGTEIVGASGSNQPKRHFYPLNPRPTELTEQDKPNKLTVPLCHSCIS